MSDPVPVSIEVLAERLKNYAILAAIAFAIATGVTGFFYTKLDTVEVSTATLIEGQRTIRSELESVKHTLFAIRQQTQQTHSEIKKLASAEPVSDPANLIAQTPTKETVAADMVTGMECKAGECTTVTLSADDFAAGSGRVFERWLASQGIDGDKLNMEYLETLKQLLPPDQRAELEKAMKSGRVFFIVTQPAGLPSLHSIPSDQ